MIKNCLKQTLTLNNNVDNGFIIKMSYNLIFFFYVNLYQIVILKILLNSVFENKLYRNPPEYLSKLSKKKWPIDPLQLG